MIGLQQERAEDIHFTGLNTVDLLHFTFSMVHDKS